MIYLVIVTYNRKELLLRLLKKIFSQKNELLNVVIVDNNSQDLTKSYIEDNFIYFNQIQWLDLQDNLGGAGGFYEGIKYVFEKNAEWIWVMDDDGYPDESCLQKLFSTMIEKKLEAISPLQIDICNHNQLAFPVRLNKKQITGSVHQLFNYKFLYREANLFNGFLFNRSVVKKVGLPKKELFIRGDEVEYTKRLIKNNIKFGTLISAKFYHPSDEGERVLMLAGLITTRDAHSEFKNYYMFRNRAVAFIEDGNIWLIPLDFIRYIYYFMIFKKFDWRSLKLWCIATYDGIKGKLGRNPKY